MTIRILTMHTLPFIFAALAMTNTASAQLLSCEGGDEDADAPPVDAWVTAAESRLGEWVTDFESSRLQVLVSAVDVDADGSPCLRTARFRVGEEFVYVASAIKPLAAVAALRLLEGTEGWSPDAEFRFEAFAVDLDPPAANGATSAEVSEPGTLSVEDAIRGALVSSSNEGYNRLYDLLGPDELNASVDAMGLSSARLSHRLSIGDTDPRSDHYAPAVELRVAEDWTPFRPRREAAMELYPGFDDRHQVGLAHYDPVSGDRVEEPFDFGTRNEVALDELHALMVALIEPELAPGIDPGIDSRSRQWLTEFMTRAAPDTSPEQDVRHAPLQPGLAATEFAEDYSYVSKSGYAYGFHVENAWIQDASTGASIFVTVAVHVNEDQVVNDNRYEYETRSFPLMRFMGAQVGAYLVGNQSPKK